MKESRWKEPEYHQVCRQDVGVAYRKGNVQCHPNGRQPPSFAAGYDADINAVEGDPLTDAARLRQVSFVMKGGTVYEDTVSAPKR